MSKLHWTNTTWFFYFLFTSINFHIFAALYRYRPSICGKTGVVPPTCHAMAFPKGLTHPENRGGVPGPGDAMKIGSGSSVCLIDLCPGAYGCQTLKHCTEVYKTPRKDFTAPESRFISVAGLNRGNPSFLSGTYSTAWFFCFFVFFFNLMATEADVTC